MKWITLVCVMSIAVFLVGPTQAAVILNQDFESGLGANESTSGNFAINNTGFGNNGTFMMGHANGYGNNEYSYYQISNLDLTNFTNVLLTFDFRGAFETHFDRFNVLASTSPIAPPAGLLTPTALSGMKFIDLGDTHHPNLGQFAYDSSAAAGGQSGVAMFDLSAFAGSTVNLRFQFGSDGSITSSGFNMDNVLITGDQSAVPEPAGLTLMGLGAFGLLGGAVRRCRKTVA